jgi:xanthine dehydrogenase accessory factor
MAFYQTLAELTGRGEALALCTIVRSQGSTPRREGSKMLVLADGRIIDTVGGGEMENRVIAAALQSLQDGQPCLLSYQFTDPERGDPGVCGGQVEVFVEPILPPATVVVAGAGHVGKAVAHLAGWLGFRVVINDDRPDFCTPENAPGADLYLPGPLSRLPEQLALTPWTYVVMTTRGVSVDVEGLPELLKTPAGYIGVIGSRRRWALARQQLQELGIPEAQIERVHSPIGLELNAETPEEIAVSILAEIIMLRRRGDGTPMSAAVRREANT